jgi:hypothetical protein
VNLIPWLLLPLAGPTPDSFSEEEIDQLPLGMGIVATQLYILTLYCRSGSLFSLDMDTDRDSSFTVIFLVHPYSLLPIETTCYKNH